MTQQRKLSDADILNMQRMRAGGATRADIGKTFGVSVNTVHFYTCGGFYEPPAPRKLTAAECRVSRFLPGLKPRWARA